MITDDYIEELFRNTDFGEVVNSSIEEKRQFLRKSILLQQKGYWSGSTIYNIMIVGGFIVDGRQGTEKVLTLLGKKLTEDV